MIRSVAREKKGDTPVKNRMIGVVVALLALLGTMLAAAPAHAAPDGELWGSERLDCDNASGTGAGGVFKIRNNYDGMAGFRRLIVDFNDEGNRDWNWKFLTNNPSAGSMGTGWFWIDKGQATGDFHRERWAVNQDGSDGYRVRVENDAGNVICTATMWMM